MNNLINKIKSYVMMSHLKEQPVTHTESFKDLKYRMSNYWEQGKFQQAYDEIISFDFRFGSGDGERILNDYHCQVGPNVVKELQGERAVSVQFVKEDEDYGANEDIIGDEEDKISNYDVAIESIQNSRFFFYDDQTYDFPEPSTKKDFMGAVDSIITAAQVRP